VIGRVYRVTASRTPVRRPAMLSSIAPSPGCYTSGATEQQIVNLFAKVAKPRLMDLLKLRVRHVYETTPGMRTLRS
jgi:hypothetical protein